MTSPQDQSQYQVRFDWGHDGALSVGSDVDVIILVDAIATAAAGNGERAESRQLFPAPGTVMIAGSLRNRTAVAEWGLARQDRAVESL